MLLIVSRVKTEATVSKRDQTETLKQN